MNRSKIGVVVGLQAEARLLRGLGFAVAVGGGMPDGAARAAEALIAADAEALISFGLAGGLKFGMPAGTIIVPSAVVESGTAFPCDPDLLRWLGSATALLLLAGQEIAVTTEQKAELFTKTGAVAVDLESGAVARVATAATIPFAVLRAISDPADRDLPPAALIALDHSGKISLPRVLHAVFRNPAQIPELTRLARNTATARSALVKKLQNLA